MTVNRTTLLDLPLPVTGTESGTWGDTTNNGLTQYLDIAIAGTLVLSTDADVTLTSTEGDSSATNIGATTAQYAILRWTATGSTTRNITALAQSKTYVVINATGGTQSIVLRGAGPTTGVTIISGEKAFCVWNGSDFVKVSSSAAAGGSNTQVQYNSSGVLAGSSNLTFDGTSLTLGGNPTLSAGTANGVLYLNGSKVATSGSALTFTGSVLGVNNSGDSDFKLTTSNTGSGSTDGLLLRINSTGSEAYLWNWEPSSVLIFGANGSEQMRLTSTGLGIGTTSPSAKLELANTGGSVAARLRSSDSGYAELYFADVSDNAASAISYEHSTNLLRFYNGGSARVVLDTSGNLGLGVTPSLWNNITALQIQSGSLTAGSVDTYLSSNAFYSTASPSGWKYITPTNATQFYQNASGGEFVWRTAPSGTAGNAITFTQAMTLDASANLLLNVTSPYGYGGSFKVAQVRGGSTTNGGIFRAENSDATIGAHLGVDSTGGFVGTQTNHPTVFVTNNAERARITSGGDFRVKGAGTAGSTDAFQVSGSAPADAARIDSSGNLLVGTTSTVANAVLVASKSVADYVVRFINSNATAYGVVVNYSGASPNSTGQEFFRCVDSTVDRMTVRSNGGIANYQSNNVDLSDARTKKDITPAPSYWNKIAALEIVTYKYNDQTHDDINVGVIAQQVESVEPVWVDADGFGKTPEDGVPLKTVYTKDITFAAIKALQEAMARIETLEAKVSALEGN